VAQASRNLRIYTVVEVWRGIAVGARNFRRLQNAQKYMVRLRRRRNFMEDDVQLFKGVLTNCR
jgi:hypothetical protein